MFKRPYYGSILASMHQYAHEKGWHIRFIRLFDEFSNPTLFNELIHPNEISGVILFSLEYALNTPEDRTLLAQIIERVERVVCVEWEWPGVPSIQFDRQKAAYQATQHLIACGRRRIAYIGPEDARVQGYQQALWEAGLVPEPDLIFHADDTALGNSRCEELMQTRKVIDGLCAGSDEVGLGLLSCLQRHGLSVPSDVAVASIDNLDFSAFTIPPLTTVDIPKHEIGYHAIETLISNYPREHAGAFSITVPTQLVVRASSAVDAKALK
jgi:LacI family transcriptional regulator